MIFFGKLILGKPDKDFAVHNIVSSYELPHPLIPRNY